ncbi:MAG TPA: MFS transporter [Candidatus Acidoferrum sp.]|nr:MFS transporter [Candidatus Acidoferrum sp.]
MNKAVRFKLFIMMALEIAIWGSWQVQIFNYMPMLKFEGWQINLAGSMFAIASVVGIFFSNQFADRNFAAEKFLSFSHLIGGLALVGAAFSKTFAPFFSCFLLYGLFYVPTISVTNSLAFANLKDPAKDFGFVRMGGTIGWIVVSWPFIFLLGAQSTVEQMRWIFLVGAMISFVLAAFSLTLPHTPPRRDAEGMDKLAWVKAVKLLGIPSVFVLFVVTLIDSTIHNGYFVLIGGFLQNAIKMPNNWIMAVTTIGQVAEIVTMVILGTVLKRIGWKWTMLLGIVGHGVRFLVFAFFGSPEHQGLIIAVQVLHGICYAFFFATLYIYVDAVFPKDIRTSAQGLFNLLILGVGLIIANFWFGPLQQKWLTSTGAVDYQSVFLVPTGLAALGMLLLFVFFKPPTARPQEQSGTGAAPH